MNGKALWITKCRKMVQERNQSDRAQAAERALMTAGAIISAVFFVGAMVAPLCAQSYPDKPIRLILPLAPGGTVDMLGRIIGPKLAERLGQPVLCENRPGAGGNIAYEYTAKARPDGYTLVVGSQGLSISPSFYRKLNYDPINDLAPISLIAEVPVAVLVRPGIPVRNLKEFVEYAKANPGKLNFGSDIGTGPHLAGELLKSLAKINIVHVSYKGSSQALVGLMSGEIDMQLLGVPSALPHIRDGKVRAIAVLGSKRSPSLPDVPTPKEVGIDNYEVTNWYGILAPAKTPRDIVNRLSAEWIKVAAMPDTAKMMQKAEYEPLSGTPEQFSEFLKTETARWARVIKEANIKSTD